MDLERVIPLAGSATEILLVQAPYPGKSKFVGKPTSLLAAASRFSPRLLQATGYIDEQWIAESAEDRIRALCRTAPLRAVCISTCTAAVESAKRIAEVVKEERGEEVLVVAGGPHEDDCSEKLARRLPAIDISIAGAAEDALAALLDAYLASAMSASRFRRSLDETVQFARVAGSFTVSAHDRTVNYHGRAGGSASFGSQPTIRESVRFTCFSAARTHQVMLTRGCPYGQCVFCAEPNNARSEEQDYRWLSNLLASNPEDAVYFQDAVMPSSRRVRQELLPLLAESGVEWGCQLYLPMASPEFIAALVESGCRYLYTGLETASPSLRLALGKPPLDRKKTLERLALGSVNGATWGISLVFGVIGERGELIESAADLEATAELAHQIAGSAKVQGFFPNVLTILPGTALERSLAENGLKLDFYDLPRTSTFDGFEDGGVGYNFLTLASQLGRSAVETHARRLEQIAASLTSLGLSSWGSLRSTDVRPVHNSSAPPRITVQAACPTAPRSVSVGLRDTPDLLAVT